MPKLAASEIRDALKTVPRWSRRGSTLRRTFEFSDFVAAMKIVLGARGVLTMEFPHVLRLIDENQFDTIYHEHFSYFSVHTTKTIFEHHVLELFDVEELPTHGGSLRIYAKHNDDDSKAIGPAVAELLDRERAFGLTNVDRYAKFSEQVIATKRGILDLLIGLKREGKQIVGYGAPGKGNTLLNYCGIRTDFLDFTVDRNPYKQGLFLPGSRIPILATDEIDRVEPDYVFILPWNFRDEIMEQLAHIREWGGQFIVPIPEAHVVP